MTRRHGVRYQVCGLTWYVLPPVDLPFVPTHWGSSNFGNSVGFRLVRRSA